MVVIVLFWWIYFSFFVVFIFLSCGFHVPFLWFCFSSFVVVFFSFCGFPSNHPMSSGLLINPHTDGCEIQKLHHSSETMVETKTCVGIYVGSSENLGVPGGAKWISSISKGELWEKVGAAFGEWK